MLQCQLQRLTLLRQQTEAGRAGHATRKRRVPQRTLQLRPGIGIRSIDDAYCIAIPQCGQHGIGVPGLGPQGCQVVRSGAQHGHLTGAQRERTQHHVQTDRIRTPHLDRDDPCRQAPTPPRQAFDHLGASLGSMEQYPGVSAARTAIL
ncbi:hypothetical protein SDC9_170785 [bioreactor metagenome]|uniref:Uncharacterized protein n=1 Tax=bioreactor metagenome TaxID=1076179 RepID=A0A645G921_9ZZZZ